MLRRTSLPTLKGKALMRNYPFFVLKTLNVVKKQIKDPRKVEFLVVSAARGCMILLWLTESRNTTPSADDIAVQSCFFDIQLTNLSPRNCIPPEVLLRVSMHPAWSASEKAVRSKPEPFGYQMLACFVSHYVCATCGKCVFNSNHDACVSKFLNDVNARTKKPHVVSVSSRKPKGQANKSVATPHKKTIVQLILFIVDSGCTKHMTGNLSLLCNFVEKYLGTVHFGNDQFALILGYGDLVQGNITINSVYYVEDLQGNDLLTGNHGTDIYTIYLLETTSPTPICLMAKASPTQAWLWHRRLSHLNFNYIYLLSKKDVVIVLPKLKYVKDQLCSSCEVSKAKRSSFKSKTVPSSKGWFNMLHIDLCGPMRVASINGKKYILLIVNDYSRYTWTLFLRSKDETPEVLKSFSR
ncbi:retrovirus-related pol polyprotein from transposon TNT 1-94 [Tanacetum coccineum]